MMLKSFLTHALMESNMIYDSEADIYDGLISGLNKKQPLLSFRLWAMKMWKRWRGGNNRLEMSNV